MVKPGRRLFNEKNWERLRDAQDQYDFWSNLIQPPQEGLQPLIGDFYVTPNEPVDPFDCERWPDSPYCGGNPLGEIPVGIDLNIVQDACNLGVQATGKLGFITLPSFQIVYRNPNCNLGDPPPEPEPEYDEPDNFQFPPKNCNEGLFINAREVYSGEEWGIRNDIEFYSKTKSSVTVDRVLYPDESITAAPLATVYFTYSNHSEFTTAFFVNYTMFDFQLLVDSGFIASGDWYDPYTVWKRSATSKFFFRVNLITNTNTDFIFIEGFDYTADGVSSPPRPYITANKITYEELISFNPADRRQRIIQEDTETYYRAQTFGYRWIYTCGDINYINPPPPPDDPNMACCPENTQLLRLILKKIGSDALPASVPTLLTKPDSGVMQINSITQFISYTVRQLDALCGKYPIDIEIEDIDLTQAGNQTQTLIIPNIAEALGEILGLLLLLRAESDANLSATIRGMIEAGQAKQAATLAVDYGSANAEFLGYKGKQVERDLPMSFDPTKERLEEILKQKVLKFKGWDNDDKNDINDLIAPILEMAAMWKAQNFRKTGAEDPSSKLRAILKNSVYFAKNIDDFVGNPPTPTNHPPDQPPPPKPKDEFDSFLEEAEKGFITQPGITDPINPYGKEYDRRPKIREIGTDTSGD